MMENYDNDYWENKKCPKYDCKKNSCKCGLEKVFLAAALGDDSKDSPIAPKNGAYCNAIVVYEANNHVYIYSKESIPTLVETGGDVEEAIKQLENQLAQEVLNRQAADGVLQGEIDDLKNSPDVVDIVPTYAALQAYDTSTLTDKDIIRVLEDSTHSNSSTYYRWNATTNQFDYIGEAGGGGPTVVQTTGQSTTDVMSQKATTDMVYAPYGQGIKIGANSGWDDTTGSIFIGKNAAGSDNYGEISIGNFSESSGYDGSIALGYRAKNWYGGAAIGSFSEGEDSGIIGELFGTISVGSKQSSTFTDEFGNSRTIPAFTRRVVNVHDPVDAHDAATKGYVDANAGSLVLYVKSSDMVQGNQMPFYSDAAFTTRVTIGDIYNAAFNGKDIKIISKKVNEDDFDTRTTYNVYKTNYPKVCTDESMDECGFSLCVIGHYGTYGKYAIVFDTYSGPNYYEFSVNYDNIS